MTDAPSPDARLDAILSRLDRVKRGAGGWWSARCPAHEDTTPSLGIKAGNDAIILSCRAGCPTDLVRQALGLEWKQLFYDDRRPVERVKQPIDRRGLELEAAMMALRLQDEEAILARCRAERGWIAAALKNLGVGWDGERLTIPVKDRDGKLHDVIRYMPFGKPSRKMLAGEGRTRYPWPRPEDVDTRGHRCLYVVEGEGTAISLASAWMPVVALPGAIARQTGDLRRPGRFEGVGWHQAWAKRFKGHGSVILIPDCDEVGRLLMMTAAYDLGREGVVATVADLGLESGDAGDLLRLAASRDDRRRTRAMIEGLWAAVSRAPAQAEAMRELIGEWAAWLTNPGSAEVEPATAGWSWS